MLECVIAWCVAFLLGGYCWSCVQDGEDYIIFLNFLHVVILVGAIGALIYREIVR